MVTHRIMAKTAMPAFLKNIEFFEWEKTIVIKEFIICLHIVTIGLVGRLGILAIHSD